MIHLVLSAVAAALIIGGLAVEFYCHGQAENARKELWRREDARAAGTVPYGADGYEDWTLPVPETPNAPRYVRPKQRVTAPERVGGEEE